MLIKHDKCLKIQNKSRSRFDSQGGISLQNILFNNYTSLLPMYNFLNTIKKRNLSKSLINLKHEKKKQRITWEAFNKKKSL